MRLWASEVGVRVMVRVRGRVRVRVSQGKPRIALSVGFRATSVEG